MYRERDIERDRKRYYSNGSERAAARRSRPGRAELKIVRVIVTVIIIVITTSNSNNYTNSNSNTTNSITPSPPTKSFPT